MKKINKTIVVLASSIMLLSYTSNSIYAIEEKNSNSELAVTSDVNTKPEETLDLLSEFISSKGFAADAYISEDIISSDVITVNIYYWWEEEEIVKAIKEFMKENNIDTSSVNFLVWEDIERPVLGDANGDNKLDIRDCAYIASMLSHGRADELTDVADYNFDGFVNIRDAMSLARHLVIK